VQRLLVVGGGAASLEVAPGTLLLDSPTFPDEYKVEAIPGKQFLDDLRAETALDWTFLSPPAIFAPGERTGKYRVDKDQLLSDASGQSRLSMEDYAVAMVDELEHPRMYGNASRSPIEKEIGLSPRLCRKMGGGSSRALHRR
jgi:uncharacterized protein